MTSSSDWQIVEYSQPPDWLIDQVGMFAAALIWRRGLEPDAIAAFLNPKLYKPASAFAFGDEITWATKRIQQAYEQGEKVAIWGDFDADGITATAVLWEGLGQFFAKNDKLVYYIPNRLEESHGLSIAGINTLLDCQLIITCDTGSTSLKEIGYLNSLQIDTIITDHHTLPSERPAVTAIINPRNLEPSHPLYHLSGVAVAYKLMEGLYETMPIAQQPLENLWDLVAIGLVADLVQLVGDCRYLAQIGIGELKKQKRVGVELLLAACKRAGDRPTDISFGIAPRINSISRIWGDVRKCVELLTSNDRKRCQELVNLAEQANTQRKALQKKIFAQAQSKISQIDLSTTGILVLADEAWDVGILGLVAGQIAGEYKRPVVLFNVAEAIAKGSARSPVGIDLYDLIQGQEHLLTSFGGHPLAAGLSLPATNLGLFKASVNQRFWQKYGQLPSRAIAIDLKLTVADLGQDLFRQLKQLEPYGMGNPTPRLLIEACHFEQKFNANIKDRKGQKVEYIKSEFLLVDSSGSIRGDWWGHYSYEIPDGNCDVVVELVDNSFKKAYEVRIIDIHPQQATSAYLQPTTTKGFDQPELIAIDGEQTWQKLVGIAKYLSRTGQVTSLAQLQNHLGISQSAVMKLGLEALGLYGWQVEWQNQQLKFKDLEIKLPRSPNSTPSLVKKFIATINEISFRYGLGSRAISDNQRTT